MTFRIFSISCRHDRGDSQRSHILKRVSSPCTMHNRSLFQLQKWLEAPPRRDLTCQALYAPDLQPPPNSPHSLHSPHWTRAFCRRRLQLKPHLRVSTCKRLQHQAQAAAEMGPRGRRGHRRLADAFWSLTDAHTDRFSFAPGGQFEPRGQCHRPFCDAFQWARTAVKVRGSSAIARCEPENPYWQSSQHRPSVPTVFQILVWHSRPLIFNVQRYA